MCTYVNPRARVAKRNIRVWKILDQGTWYDPLRGKYISSLVSPSIGFEYKLGQRYVQPADSWAVARWAGSTGRGVNEGAFHAHGTLASAKRHRWRGRLYEAIIPKGAKYMRGFDCDKGLVVSSELIVQRKYRGKRAK